MGYETSGATFGKKLLVQLAKSSDAHAARHAAEGMSIFNARALISEAKMEFLMRKVIVAGTFITLVSACAPSGANVISFTPQVWEGNERMVVVTRQGYNVTSSDTERLAQAHCEKFDKNARLTELANPFKLPFADKFACE